MTLPNVTESTNSGATPERRSVSRITTAPSSVALVPLSVPLNAPIAVRTGAHNTISRDLPCVLRVLIAILPVISGRASDRQALPLTANPSHSGRCHRRESLPCPAQAHPALGARLPAAWFLERR